MIRSAYINGVQAIRRPLDSVGFLAFLDRRADNRWVHWFRSLFAIYNVEDLVGLSTPWWTYKATDEVERWIGDRSTPLRAFEWGAGASTMWLSSRVAELHSVEHHPDFADTVRSMAPDHVTLHVVEPKTTGANPVAPSTKPGHEHLDFEEYVATIGDVGGSFDLIVIDGRARSTCLAAALPHLADDGMIVFDNTNRDEYRQAMSSHGVEPNDFRGLTPAAPFPTTTSLIHGGANS